MNAPVPVAVTGMGCICAAGKDFPACVQTLFSKDPDPKPPSRFTARHPETHPVFEIEASTLTDLHSKEDLSVTAALAVAAARQALEDAGWDPEALSRVRTGVCMGTTVGCTLNDEAFYRTYRSGTLPDLFPVRRFLSSNPAEAVARTFDLSGPCLTLSNACCSGADAIGTAMSWIRRGICDVAIAGGADELSRVTYNGFIALMITDTRPCRPFDRDRNGLNLGEGAAVMILEPEASRRVRKRAPRAFVLGYGSAADGYHLTAPDPDGAGLRRAAGHALSADGKTLSRIAFVAAHGTGTKDNDAVEARVLDALLPGIPFFSTKGHTGHTLGAAGAIQAVLAAACLNRRTIPGSAGFSTPDPQLPAHPTRYPRTIRGDLALSESLGFGGANAVLLLERGEDSS